MKYCSFRLIILVPFYGNSKKHTAYASFDDVLLESLFRATFLLTIYCSSPVFIYLRNELLSSFLILVPCIWAEGYKIVFSTWK